MKILIISNWKCNPVSTKEAEKILAAVSRSAKKSKKAEVVICPSFLHLAYIAKKAKSFKIGSQDLFWESKGAFTGEVSALMLASCGCKYSIIGHSERRIYFGETDETANKKIKAAIKEKIIPILCVGETEKERSEGRLERVLDRQIRFGLESISNSDIKKSGLCIAYEPLWAIGTGNPCGVDEAQTAGLLLKKILSNIFGFEIADVTRILYGGSVNSKNSAGYIKEAGLQGLLVGGASLDPKEFSKIIESI
jgi:triosephosphate isomerase (TIM)